jgi:hypothetical protein
VIGQYRRLRSVWPVFRDGEYHDRDRNRNCNRIRNATAPATATAAAFATAATEANRLRHEANRC